MSAPQPAMERATRIARAVYRDFFEQVIVAHVLEDRKGQLSEKEEQRVEIKGTHIDGRLVRLMTLSGKGGAGHREYRNVTLLDHLLSVVRGSITLAAHDWLLRRPDMDEALLRRRLAGMAAIAFLHDLDKDLELSRDAPIPLEAVTERMARYGITGFLAACGLALDAGQMRYLVEKVEGTQAHRHPPAQLPPRELEALTSYVRLADKLDGHWLASDPVKGGLKGVLWRLQNDEGCLHSDLLRHWRPIEIFDPHHPFLLDEMQRWLSLFSDRLGGIPPLLELHQDGRLYALLPEGQVEIILERALGQLKTKLPFGLELTVSNRGLPQLQGGQPDHQALAAFMMDRPLDELRPLFYLKAPLKEALTAPLDRLLGPIGLQPHWPKKSQGLITPFAGLSDLDETAHQYLPWAAYLALLLNLKLDIGPRSPLPTTEQREQAIVDLIPQSMPDWLVSIEDGLSRRNLLALWLTALAADDPELEALVWGDGGILQQWLEGNGQTPGLRTAIPGKGEQIALAVERHFRQLLGRVRVAPQQEDEQGRCLFTNAPVPFEETIDTSTGLKVVRVSAFSGRDARPETLLSEAAHTNVGSVSLAEHKLRAEVHARQGGRDNGVATLISSPTTSALFGGLLGTDDRRMPALSVYDLSRLEINKGTVVRGDEPYRGRYRIARLERIAEKNADQVDQLRLFLHAALRIGRPIHLFRGLPTPQRAFFSFDAMPKLLVNLVGDKELRLEEIPPAIERLQLAHVILNEPGLGYDTLRLYANPHTRLRGVALAWCHLDDRESKAVKVMRTLDDEFNQLTLEEADMQPEDGALVRLGRAAAGIQRYVGSRDSTSKQMMVFKIALEALEGCRQTNQVDRASLVNAVAGELEQNLIRRDEMAASTNRGGNSLADGCLAVAELMVDEVWLKIFRGRSPTQSQRRILGSIYRMAVLQEHSRLSKARHESTPQANESDNDPGATQ